MKPVLLFRKNKIFQDEINIAKKYFDVYHHRTDIPANSFVIPRFTMLPYPEELEYDVLNLKSKLINTASQHQYIAQFDYYYDIEKYTPRTWFRFEDIPFSKREQPFVIKGKTNSKKFEWKEKMFCENFNEVVKKGSALLMDSAISEQGIIIREFQELETFETLDNGLPITNEWRIFFFQEEVIAFDYYWGIIEDKTKVVEKRKDFEENGLYFAKEVAKNISEFVPFFVLDVAKTNNGHWIIIEINDGCQSGLNHTIDPDIFYKNLFKSVNK